jgi:hypothetical protein
MGSMRVTLRPWPIAALSEASRCTMASGTYTCRQVMGCCETKMPRGASPAVTMFMWNAG